MQNPVKAEVDGELQFLAILGLPNDIQMRLSSEAACRTRSICIRKSYELYTILYFLFICFCN